MDDPILTKIQSLKSTFSVPQPDNSLNCLSYQELNHTLMSKTIEALANSLQESHAKNPSSQIVQKILQDPTMFNNSIWAHAPAIIEQLSICSSPMYITHSHYYSQSILLSLFLAHNGFKSTIFGSKNQIESGWASCTIPLSEIDKVSSLKSLIKSENIGFVELEKMYEKKWQALEEKQIEIWDLFNTHPAVYRPFIIQRLQKIKQGSNSLIIYGSEGQQKEINELLFQCEVEVEYLEICERWPYQMVKTNKIEEQITSFLHEELNYPNKQDIVIFADPTPHYLRHLKQILKKSDPQFLKITNFITGPNQTQKLVIPQPANTVTKSVLKGQSQSSPVSNNRTHNNIFIAPNFHSLISWGYEYNKVFYVFDYRQDKKYGFNYSTLIYQEHNYEYISQAQFLGRLSLIGVHNPGKYCYENDDGIDEDEDSVEYLKKHDENIDIGRYLLQMIELGLNEIIDRQKKKSRELSDCQKNLIEAKIISKQGESSLSKILNTNLLSYLWQVSGLNPILCLNILQYPQDKDNAAKMKQLLAMATSVIMTPGNMRQIPANPNSFNDRPSPVWRQTGYLHSCVDVLVRTKIIEQKQQTMNERTKSRLTSKQSYMKRLSQTNSCEFDVFGGLFEIIQANRMTFDEMKVEDLLRQEFVNETTYHKVVNQYDLITQALDLDSFNSFTSFSEISDVIDHLTARFDRGGGVYSGSRRIGYFIKGQNSGIFPNKFSLISLLNERPPFIYITRLLKNQEKPNKATTQILMCNHLTEQQYMSLFGTLPAHKASSYGETQAEFHGISTATFHELCKNESRDILNFQKKHECYIELNEEIAMISVHCAKQKESIVTREFQEMLEKIKNKLISETKITNYLGTSNILLGSGGSTLQVIKDKYINQCYLSNISLDADLDDLHQLFDEFFNLQEIKFVEDGDQKSSFKTAHITFHSQKDFYRFSQYYNECKYLERFLKVTGIQGIQNQGILSEEMFLEFSWNSWKSNQEASIQFEDPEIFKKAMEFLLAEGCKVDNKKVGFSGMEEKNVVHLKGLGKFTDEHYLENIFGGLGKIKHLDILKTPLKENLKAQQEMLMERIKKEFPDDEIDIKARNVEKLKNGIRKCEIVFKDLNKLNQTQMKLQDQIGVAGVGRVHIKSCFTYPIQVPFGYTALYQELLQHAMNQMANNNKIVTEHIHSKGKEYMVAKSPLKQEIDALKEKMKGELGGYLVDLTGFETSILLSDVGIQNLFDLEEKYTCRLLPNFNDKVLIVQTRFENRKKIAEEVKAKVNDNFFYRIPLTQKAFKNLKENPSSYLVMKEQYHLKVLELEEVGKNLLLEGSANHVQGAFNYLMHIMEAAVKPEEELLNADVCGICCEEPFRPYRLQQCGHKFCLQCMVDSISSALGDISMFPIKCPQCLAIVIIQDLNSLLTPDLWPKLINMSVNQYIGRNPQIISSCYTAGCKQINFIINGYFKCDTCNQSFCLECKMNYHPGLTCEQAKQGGTAAFEKFMRQNNIRRCPNDKCKFPIERTDGCYRVTCTKCGKSMCFKCQPDKMIAYDHYNECYKHLQDAHGGYW